MKETKLKPQWKRNILIAAVLVFVGAAAWLNWSYNQRWGQADPAMAAAEDEMSSAVDAILKTGRETAEPAVSGPVSDYFAKARLTRQQSRDQALSLLETAASGEGASREVIDSAMSDITAMANWALMESKIENELLAKGFAECVVYLSAEGCTVAVPASLEGLSDAEVAQISDAVMTNTDCSAAQINVIEVMY